MSWNLIGYSFCRIWQVQSFTLMSAMQIIPFASAFYWLSSGATLGLTVYFIARKKSPSQRIRSLAVTASFILAPLGTISLFLGLKTSYIALYALGVLLSGAGLALLWLAWADRFSAEPSRTVINYTLVDVAIMIAFDMFANLFTQDHAGNLLLFAIAPIASFVLLFQDLGEKCLWKNSDAPTPCNANAELPRSFIGLCIISFAFPFAYHLSVTFVYPDIDYLERDGGDLISLLICLLIAANSKTRTSHIGVYRIAIPIILLGFTICSILPTHASAINALIAGGGFKVGSLILWIMLIELARKSTRPFFILGLGLMCTFLGNSFAIFMSGFFIQSVGISPDRLAIALATLLVCLLSWSFPAFSESKKHDKTYGRRDGTTALDAIASLENHCSFLASEFKLTKREAEILPLLAEGRSQAVIALKLGIEKGTVHSHVLHIYQKIGIHSQQELIDRVSTRNVSNCPPPDSKAE